MRPSEIGGADRSRADPHSGGTRLYWLCVLGVSQRYGGKAGLLQEGQRSVMVQFSMPINTMSRQCRHYSFSPLSTDFFPPKPGRCSTENPAAISPRLTAPATV